MSMGGWADPSSVRRRWTRTPSAWEEILFYSLKLTLWDILFFTQFILSCEKLVKYVNVVNLHVTIRISTNFIHSPSALPVCIHFISRNTIEGEKIFLWFQLPPMRVLAPRPQTLVPPSAWAESFGAHVFNATETHWAKTAVQVVLI